MEEVIGRLIVKEDLKQLRSQNATKRDFDQFEAMIKS